MSLEEMRRILLVDDDANLLEAVGRQFRGKFDMMTAQGGTAGLELIQSNGPFAVVISDMRMPDMNGIQFLAHARELSPDTVRIMLTGNADLDTAMHAVNEGNIFRFLLKPCRRETMEWAVEAALEQHRLVTAECELLEKTLRGSVQVLIDVLALANPLAFSRALRLKDYVSQIVGHLNVRKIWEVEIAALLSQIGCVALPLDIVSQVYAGGSLSGEEQKMYSSHPEVGSKLVSLIPRLETVGKMIAGQNIAFKDTGLPYEGIVADRGVFGAQILKVCLDFDTLCLRGATGAQALAQMKARGDEYHQAIVKALERVKAITMEEEREIAIRDLADSMVLARDVFTRNGLLLAPKGYKVTLSLRVRLENYAQRNEIDKRIRVLIPLYASHAAHVRSPSGA